MDVRLTPIITAMGITGAAALAGGLVAGHAIAGAHEQPTPDARRSMLERGWVIGGAVIGTSMLALGASLIPPRGSTSALGLMASGLVGGVFGAIGIAAASGDGL